MTSNQHFGVDVLDVVFGEDEPFAVKEFISKIDKNEVGERNPFGDNLKSRIIVDFEGKKWLAERQFENIRYDDINHQIDGSKFTFSIRFDAAAALSQINAEKFGYSLASKLVGSTILGKRLKQETGFRDGSCKLVVSLGAPEQGSIRHSISVAIITVGSFVGFYPELKQGFQEIYGDVVWLSSRLETALRSSKIPDEPYGNDEELLAIIEKRRGLNRQEDDL